jgi:hypothetical protein
MKTNQTTEKCLKNEYITDIKKIITVDELENIKDVMLESANNPNVFKEYKYIEKNNLKDDLISIIKSCQKYNIHLRLTDKNSKKQFIFVDNDFRFKLYGACGTCTKSDTIYHLSRLKYVLNLENHKLSRLSVYRILADRRKIKDIEIDHIDKNIQNNMLSNLQAIPRKINGNPHFNRLKTIDGMYAKEKYCNQYECEYLLTFF